MLTGINRYAHLAPPLNNVKRRAIGQLEANALHFNPLRGVVGDDDFQYIIVVHSLHGDCYL